MSAVGTAEDLHASASRITGLSDFGPDDYTDGLGVLLESYARDAELTPALAESTGSVVMINSMVVRYSQRRMGPYKLAKAALLAMAQSLATELGPQGIRVNSVAPGHIWGDSLKWYFGYQAHKRGVDIQEIYDETAAGIDLGRLPEPDEIADAVVFLASPLARAITGQCLDVNCGEYHH